MRTALKTSCHTLQDSKHRFQSNSWNCKKKEHFIVNSIRDFLWGLIYFLKHFHMYDTYWNKYGPVSIEHLGGECGPNLRNSIFAWFWYSSTLFPDCKLSTFWNWQVYIEIFWTSINRIHLLTCSSSVIVPTRGNPSTTLAIIVIRAIFIACYSNRSLIEFNKF